MAPPNTSPSPSDDRPPLLSVHTALVLLIALLVGLAVGMLMYAAGRHPAEAVVAGIGSSAAAGLACHKLIGY